MGQLCQRGRRDGRNPPPGAFKRFPLHLNRVWQRQRSENTTELRPLGKRVEEHIWGCSQRLTFAPEVWSPWLALSAVSGKRLCHCLVQSGNTALNLAIHMARNGTSGLQGSLRLKCEQLRSSDESRMR